MKYTFLFYNVSGDFESIAMRVKGEGCPIYYFKRKGELTKGKNDTGEGIFEKDEMVDDLYEVLNKFRDNKKQLKIIVDDNGFGDEVDYLRSEGWDVLNGSAWMDQMEYERSKGMELAKEIGLDTPFEKAFTKIEDGIAFLETLEDDAQFVFKPEGESFAGSSKTYVSKGKQDIIDYLTWIKEDCATNHYTIDKFVLQEKVNGKEADFAGYCGKNGFLKETCILDIEEKKSGDGNKGEATGCMGNIIINFPKSKFFDLYIKPLEKKLMEIGFIGAISINCIFAESQGNENKQKEYEPGKPYFLEFTCGRFGWDAHLTECALIKYTGGSISDFYAALLDGKDYEIPTYLAGCGVRVYSGSVNLSKEEVDGRYFSFSPEVEPYLWFYSVSKTKAGYAIEDNPILVANTVSESLQDSIDQCYEILNEHVSIPDAYYRNDIGKRADEVIRFLSKYGWIGAKKQEKQIADEQPVVEEQKSLPEQLQEAKDDNTRLMVLRMAQEQMGSKFDAFLRDMLRKKVINRDIIHLMRTQRLLSY